MSAGAANRRGDARPLRIGLFGQFGIGNLGNEGSLEALLRFVRAQAPDADLVCICSDPSFVEGAHGVAAVPIRAPKSAGALMRLADRVLLGMPSRFSNLAHAVTHASRLDVLFVPGTGVFDDFGATSFGQPYDMWRWCRAARIGGARLAFVSVGAGPISRWLSRVLMKSAAATAGYRSYRDIPSKAFANSIHMGVPQDPVFPDLVFSLPVPERPRHDDKALTVALGVMAYYGWSGDGPAIYERYIAALSAYAVWLLNSGRRIKLVIGKDKDADAVADLLKRLEAAVPQLLSQVDPFEPAANLHDVMAQMAACDIAVATRFHNVVCALNVGTPVISLGYAEKNQALLEQMGLGAYGQDVEGFDLELLKAHTEQVIADRDRLAAAIRLKAADYAVQLAQQERILAEEFLGTAPQ